MLNAKACFFAGTGKPDKSFSLDSLKSFILHTYINRNPAQKVS